MRRSYRRVIEEQEVLVPAAKDRKTGKWTPAHFAGRTTRAIAESPSNAWIASEVPAPIPEGRNATWIHLDLVDAKEVPAYMTGAAFGFRLRGGRWICCGACITFDGDLTVDQYRGVPISKLINRARDAQKLLRSKPPKLPTARPQRGAREPDLDFYRDVAGLYRDAVKLGHRKPIVRMAEELAELLSPDSDPARTVSTWVRKARKLGYLRAAIPGKAGEAKKT
jgi:hypothetical protein